MRSELWALARGTAARFLAADRLPRRGPEGDTPSRRAPLVATLWDEPPLGHASARLADGTPVRWRRGKWSVEVEREVEFRVVARSRDR